MSSKRRRCAVFAGAAGCARRRKNDLTGAMAKDKLASSMLASLSGSIVGFPALGVSLANQHSVGSYGTSLAANILASFSLRYLTIPADRAVRVVIIGSSVA